MNVFGTNLKLCGSNRYEIHTKLYESSPVKELLNHV